MNTIQIKNSTTASNSPSSLTQGEFAINVVDGNLFYGDGSTVKQDFTFGDVIIKGTLSGSGGAQATVDLYEFGYEFSTLFPVTGSGLIVSSSNLPANHYNMVKIGETELLDINSTFTPNTFIINNVDAIIISSGSEPIDIYDQDPGGGKLFEHNSTDFKVYSDGLAKLTIGPTSTNITTDNTSVNNFSLTADLTTASIAGIPVWSSPPNTGITREIKYAPISTFVTSGSNAEVASVLIKPTPSASAGSYGAGSRVLSNFTSSMSLTAGDIYFWSSSAEWGAANATTDTTSKGLLAVAATTGGDEMVAEGIVYIGTTISGFTNGNPVYLSTTNSKIIETPPSGSGEIVRAVGYVHSTSQNTIYFNPSNDYFEVE